MMKLKLLIVISCFLFAHAEADEFQVTDRMLAIRLVNAHADYIKMEDGESRRLFEIRAHKELLTYWVFTRKLDEKPKIAIEYRLLKLANVLVDSPHFLNLIKNSSTFSSPQNTFNGFSYSRVNRQEKRSFSVRTLEDYEREMNKFLGFLKSKPKRR